MIFFNKKLNILILLIFIICIFTFIYNYITQTVETSSTPISNHIIILDAGHGFPDGGATNANSSIIESDLNLEIVLKLQNLLESSNCTIILTRSDKNGIYELDFENIKNKKLSDMKNRAFIANNSNAELFLSIHMNKLPQTQYSGYQTFYKNSDPSSREIAQNIQSSLNNFIKKDKIREIKSISGIYLTKNVDIPLVLVECGFLSNPEEAQLLSTESYQDKIAWSIYIGLMDYFNKIWLYQKTVLYFN